MSVTIEATRRSLEHIFPGDGEMARRMPALDWSQRALGAPQSWPENLRITLGSKPSALEARTEPALPRSQ